MQGNPTYVSPEKFADRFGLVIRSVRRWIREGLLPHVRLGRTILVPEDALERVMSGTAGPIDSSRLTKLNSTLTEGGAAQ